MRKQTNDYCGFSTAALVNVEDIFFSQEMKVMFTAAQTDVEGFSYSNSMVKKSKASFCNASHFLLDGEQK